MIKNICLKMTVSLIRTVYFLRFKAENTAVKVRPHGRTFVRRCPRTKVRVRLTFTSYSYFCTMLKEILSKRSYTTHY